MEPEFNLTIQDVKHKPHALKANWSSEAMAEFILSFGHLDEWTTRVSQPGYELDEVDLKIMEKLLKKD